MLIFRQLSDPVSSTYTYLLAERRSGEAILIDPVFEHVARDAALLHELDLKLAWTLETHVHADHVTGAWLHKQRSDSRIALAATAGASGADRYLQEGDKIDFGSRHLLVRTTPGHTGGCLTYILDDRSMAFTGDCLLIRGTGRTDFQHGDARQMFHSVREKIFSLPATTLLYPAHDYRGITVTSVEEERDHNPRLGMAIGEDDFVGHMAHLGLPHPKKIDVAVPANLNCGRPENDTDASIDPDWAALQFTFAGVWEITPLALREAATSVQMVDVREPDEFTGPLGHIEGATLIPLGQLAARVGELNKTHPVVAICRSGSRSAQAAVILQRAGFGQVAHLAGGMLRWRAEGEPVSGAV